MFCDEVNTLWVFLFDLMQINPKCKKKIGSFYVVLEIKRSSLSHWSRLWIKKERKKLFLFLVLQEPAVYKRLPWKGFLYNTSLLLRSAFFGVRFFSFKFILFWVLEWRYYPLNPFGWFSFNSKDFIPIKMLSLLVYYLRFS